jgi:HAD superfamily hydrolase (TIGR01509 family)
MGNIKGAILDIDGTLVDSNEAHARAWVAAMTRAGFDVPVTRVLPLIGMGGDKLLPKVTGVEADSPQGKQMGEWRKQIFMEQYLPHLRPTPGARDLLLALRNRGLELVVASSAEEEELQHLLRIAGAADLIKEQTSGSEVKESKPDPDIIHAALAKLGHPPAAVLMLGDTPYDVEAAQRAGVATVALRSGGHDADLAAAIAVYDDPADLLAHLAESPFLHKEP